MGIIPGGEYDGKDKGEDDEDEHKDEEEENDPPAPAPVAGVPFQAIGCW